ncbi:hypothetical protein MKW92_050036 [Papaver armeniacum]|nr:hypothetical protein MKW92_050036 [Papaver armeniacum]
MNSNGLHMMHGEGGGNWSMGGGFPDFGRSNDSEGLQSRGVTIVSKHEVGNAGSNEGRGGNSGGHGGEAGEQMYLKGGDEEGN